jgi:transcriptional regulator with XRE-family HTH domain
MKPKAVSNKIYNLIQSQIKSKHITLDSIALKTGYTRSYIHKLIRSPNISAVNLQKLSEILGYNFFNHLYSDAYHKTPEQWNELESKNRKLQRDLIRCTRKNENFQETIEILTTQIAQISKANINPKPPEPPNE